MFDGMILGVLTWLSMIFSFQHLPFRIRKFMLNHFILTDIISVALTFIFLSSISRSITSVIGCIVCGLLVNITLVIHKNMRLNENRSATNSN